MKKIFLFALLFSFDLPFVAQVNVKGSIVDVQGQQQAYASVALLLPADSTVQAFGMSNKQGAFELKAVKSGTYLLQINQYGYELLYSEVKVEKQAIDLGVLLLSRHSRNLEELKVGIERVPVVINGDTINYNAAAFKTAPDASVEDLLKKMPGIEVDEAGNIKAQGENVSKITVEGQEVFSNDPKVVSKNLPAEAVKKVQVFEEKTAAEEATGMADGNKDKTINLVLKDDRKNLLFGTLSGGLGYQDRYQGVAKAFRFGKENQFAALGNLNNINQFGFSIQDYMDYSGGLSQMANGDVNIQINGDEFPIDFGRPVLGNIQSGVGGINFTHSKLKDRQLNLTWLGSGQLKQLHQEAYQETYLPGLTLLSDQYNNNKDRFANHSLSFRFKDKSKAAHEWRINGGLQYKQSGSQWEKNSFNFRDLRHQDSLTSDFIQDLSDKNLNLKADLNASYTHKSQDSSRLRLWSVSTESRIQHVLGSNSWNNLSHFYPFDSELEQQMRNQRQEDFMEQMGYSALLKLNKSWYLEGNLNANWQFSQLTNEQLDELTGETIDTLSPQYNYDFQQNQADLRLRLQKKKWQIAFGSKYALGHQRGKLNQLNSVKNIWNLPLPLASVEYQFNREHRISLVYQNQLSTPAMTQLIPAWSTINRFSYVIGNPNLKVEKIQSLNVHWMFYDPFTFVSFFANAEARHTRDKISSIQQISSDFTQRISYINVDRDYAFNTYLEASSPIRKLGVNIRMTYRNDYSLAYSWINGLLTNLSNSDQRYTLTIDNRKKKIWDISLGGEYSFTRSIYDQLSEFNSGYTQQALLASISVKIGKVISLENSLKISQYQSSVNEFSYTLPMLKARLIYKPLKKNNWTFTLDVFDLLNRNQGIEQQFNRNVLSQSRTNALGRYAMLTISYKFSKLPKEKTE